MISKDHVDRLAKTIAELQKVSSGNNLEILRKIECLVELLDYSKASENINSNLVSMDKFKQVNNKDLPPWEDRELEVCELKYPDLMNLLSLHKAKYTIKDLDLIKRTGLELFKINIEENCPEKATEILYVNLRDTIIRMINERMLIKDRNGGYYLARFRALATEDHKKRIMIS